LRCARRENTPAHFRSSDRQPSLPERDRFASLDSAPATRANCVNRNAENIFMPALAEQIPSVSRTARIPRGIATQRIPVLVRLDGIALTGSRSRDRGPVYRRPIFMAIFGARAVFAALRACGLGSGLVFLSPERA
jgi:hypothetical protein